MSKFSIHIDLLVLPKGVDASEVATALRDAFLQKAGQGGTAIAGLRQMPPAARLDAGRVPASAGASGLGQAVSRAVLVQAPIRKGRGS